MLRSLRPLRIDVVGQHYTVEYKPGQFLIEGDEEVNKVGSEAMGFNNSTAQEMTIRDGMGADAERDTVLHETLHAIFAVTGLEYHMTVNKAEDVIRRLSPALLHVLRSNPHLTKYLMEDD